MKVRMMIRAWWRNVALVLLCALALGALFRLGRSLDMDKHYSFRYLEGRQVAVALAGLIPGQPHDYMTDSRLLPIAERYWMYDHQKSLRAILEEARQAIAAPAGPRLTLWDDKGCVDLLRAGFLLFGFHKESAYAAFFLVLGLPMAVYAAYFFRRRAPLYVLLAVLAAIYVTTPILGVDDQLRSLHEQRFFSVVGIVPLLTLLFIMSGAEASVWAVVAVVLQVAALVFVYHARNDALWQFLLVVAAVPVCWWGLRGRWGGGWRLLGRVAWPAALFAAGMIMLSTYKHLTFNSIYFEQGHDDHAYTHNLIMGLSFSPRIAREYDLAVDDAKVIRMVGRRMVAKGELNAVDDIVPIFVNDFNRYSRELRAAMFEIVRTHPVDAALSIPYKTPSILGEFRYIAGAGPPNPIAVASQHGFASEATRRDQGLYYRPFRMSALAMLLAGALLAAGARVKDWRVALVATLAIWAGSMLVPVSSIPMMYIMGPPFVTTPLAFYVAVTACAMIAAARLRS